MRDAGDSLFSGGHLDRGATVHDGLVALAAKAHGAVLASRDARATATYDALGVEVAMVRF